MSSGLDKTALAARILERRVRTSKDTAIANNKNDILEGFLRDNKNLSVAQTPKKITRIRSKVETGISLCDRRKPIPLSFSQQRIWFLNELFPDNSYYNSTYAYRINGSLELEILENCLSDVIVRHESLRTTFYVEDGEPFQKISDVDNSKPTFIVRDLTALTTEDQRKELNKILKLEVATPIEIQNETIRTSLITLSSNEKILVITLHHIVTDGWSNGILIRDLCAYYAYRMNGVNPNLEKLKIQYADYSSWQRREGWESHYQEHLAYWNSKLDAVPAVLEYPTDKPRPEHPSYVGRSITSQFDKNQTEQIKQLANAYQSSLFMILLAAFGVLLHRVSGQKCFVIGSPTANRNIKEIENLIGVFVNVMPLRINLHENISIEDHILNVRKTCLEALDHQELPFEMLVDEINPERDTSRSPIFQHTFALQQSHENLMELPGLAIESMKGELETIRYDMEVHTFLKNDCIDFAFLYATELFEPSSIERLAEQYKHVLVTMLKDPTRMIGDFSLLSSETYRQMVFQWNETAVALDERCIHQIIEQKVREFPDSIALKGDNETFSYRQLNQLADQVAFSILENRLSKQDLVAIYQHKTPWLMISILGVLKAGLAYIPIDTDQPIDRFAGILQDSRSPLVLVDPISISSVEALMGSGIDGNAGLNCKVVDVESLANSTNSLDERMCSQTTPTDLAYVIYTSGSTGNPKGVMIEHRSLVNYLNWSIDAYDVLNGEGALVHTSIGFDATITSLFAPLLVGKVVEFIGERDGWAKIKQGLDARTQYSLLKVTPAHLGLLAPKNRVSVAPDKTNGVRFVVVGGDMLLGESLKVWQSEQPQARFINEYGPTETTVGCCVYEVPNNIRITGPVAIGRPISNTQLYVLDEYQQPVPVGVTGELYIGGEGVARGYLNQPTLTAEKFLDNPFGIAGKIYKSGDLVRYKADGNIEYLGRIDNQVKIRGFRIELGEVESTLLSHDSVAECAVIIHGSGDSQRLVAYINRNTHYSEADAAIVNSEEVIQIDLEEQVGKWRQVFKHSYRSLSDDILVHENFAGWDSSYTGQPINQEEMMFWLNQTVDRILKTSPSRVLELGCGTGMILSKVAGHVGYYQATDFSQDAIGYVKQMLMNNQKFGHVNLINQDALNVLLIESDDDPVDTIILNSVIQYFPDEMYLKSVLDKALHQVAKKLSGGTVFIGDVRNYHYLETFHASVQLYQADSSDSKEIIQRRVRSQLIIEPELLLSPQYFNELMNNNQLITRVEILPKIGPYNNELSLFRYDVVLHVGGQERDTVQNKFDCVINVLDGLHHDVSLSDIDKVLKRCKAKQLLISNVLDANLEREYFCARWLSEANESATKNDFIEARDKHKTTGIDPHEILRLADQAGYDVSFSISDSGCGEMLNCLFSSDRRGYELVGEEDAKHSRYSMEYATQKSISKESHTSLPIQSRFFMLVDQDVNRARKYFNTPLDNRRIQNNIKEIKTHLAKTLPVYMIPTQYLYIDKLPLTINGKLDKEKLPEPLDNLCLPSEKYLEARTETEINLQQLFREVIGNERIGIRDSFFDLGGNSLLSIKIMSKIENEFQIQSSPKLLFDNPTIESLAEVLDTAKLDGLTKLDEFDDRPLNLAKATHLNIEIQPPKNTPNKQIIGPEKLLLTGATGFLGAYLLVSLLNSKDCNVYCLVRCNDADEGMTKLISILKQYGIWQKTYQARIVVVPGDLAKPRLAIETETYKKLLAEIDSIYHNGAWVNFNYPYKVLKDTNVEGTRSIIEMACQIKSKPIHYISTVSVFPLTEDTTAVQSETCLPDNWEDLRGGYAQSKWVAEQLIVEASQRGLPITIHRPGTIAGDSSFGACNTTDLIYQFAKVCLELGKIPDLVEDGQIGIVPVDYVAEAIVKLSMIQKPNMQIYHLAAQEYLPIKRIFDFFRDRGYAIATTPYETWRAALAKMIEQNKGSGMEPLLEIYPAKVEPAEKKEPKYCTQATLACLNPLNIFCPQLDKTLLHTYFNYLKNLKFIEDPEFYYDVLNINDSQDQKDQHEPSFQSIDESVV